MKQAVFLHGWAQSKQIWCNQLGSIPHAHYLNLPGHGCAKDCATGRWLEAVVAQLPAKPAHLVGWSLGGMLAMQVAHKYPERVASLTLVATTPRFRSTKGWPHGSSNLLFEGFKYAVASGALKSLNRFFKLMLHGDNLSRSAYNQLARMSVDRSGPPSQTGLDSGLELLEKLDLREVAGNIKQPTLIIHGEEDAIAPVAAGRWLADHISHASLRTVPACGHAPFLTQPEWFNTTVQTWWKQL